MQACHFTAATRVSQVRRVSLGRQSAEQVQISDSCTSLIVRGDTIEAARPHFEYVLRFTPEGESPKRVDIKRLVAAPCLDHLLTETGPEPIVWGQIGDQVEAALLALEGDEAEPGYWADVNQLVRPGQLSPNLETFQRDLPDDLASGLNWLAEKQFYFLISVMSPLISPAMLEDPGDGNPDPEPEPGDDTQTHLLDGAEAAMPELADKEVVALIRARNAVVAAWLWRRFASDGPLAKNWITLSPWCGILKLPAEATAAEAAPG